MRYALKTCNHLGDAVCMTSAIRNVLPRVLERGDSLAYVGAYPEVMGALPIEAGDGIEADRVVKVQYRDHGVTDIKAADGNLCEGLTRSLEAWLLLPHQEGIYKPTLPKPTPKDAEEMAQYSGCVLLNSNAQTRSSVKGYPWWHELVKADHRFVLMGDRGRLDICADMPRRDNVDDLRGKTTIGQLMALAYSARCIVSPASGIVHIAAAYHRPCVIVTGAREPTRLTEYPMARHVDSVCVGTSGRVYNKSKGCLHFRMPGGGDGGCERPVVVRGREYPACMAAIPAERVLEEMERAILQGGMA